MPWRLTLFIFCCLVLPGTAAAELQSTDFRLARDLDVKLLHSYPVTRHGYFGPLAFGVELRNRGGERQVTIEVSRPTRMSRSLRVPAGERVRAFFTVPVRTSYGSAATVRIHDGGSGRTREVVAEAQYMTEEPIARLGPISTALNVNAPFSLIGALDGRLPDDWRALSGVRAIVVEHGWALAHVSEEQWRVLIDWVAMGGVLLVSTPAAGMAEKAPWSAAQLPFARAVQQSEGGFVQQIGYGAIVRARPERLANVGGGDFYSGIGVCESCRWSVSETAVQGDESHVAARKRLRAYVSEAGWGLFVVLLVFAAVVGPIGWLWLIKRRGAPLGYLAFVIANASVFSLAVLGHDLFENGITAKCVARSLVLIDQGTGSELGVEDAALYAPTGRGTRLRLPGAGLPLLPGSALSFNEEPMQLELEGGRQLIGDGVPVRRRELAAVRWLARQRGGLELEARDDGLWVENQTGYDLRELAIWRAGKRYAVASLARGDHARAPASEGAAALDDANDTASGAVIGSASPLANAVRSGELSADRYVARYAWSPAVSALVDASVKPVAAGTHVLMGVLR